MMLVPSTSRLLLAFVSTVVLLTFPFGLLLHAQEYSTYMADTIRASRVEADRQLGRDAGARILELPDIRQMVSVTGEADAVKYIQTLPGVSTGGEGSSAFYVRGGNLGNNLTTLDGVPLYGGSHLLGLTSAYPTDIVSSVNFRVGGFHGDEGNITSSHINLITKDGNFTKKSITASASTFILGCTVSMPLVRDKVSLLGSVRISPLGPAFRAVQAVGGGVLDSLSRPQALVYDAYAKVKWLVDDKNRLSFSFFSSKDAYSYRYGGRSDEQMGWDNLVASVRHEGYLTSGWKLKGGLAYNRFHGRQGIIRDMDGTVNNIAIVSSVDEFSADAAFSRALEAYDIRLGVRERYAIFNPGTYATFKGPGPIKPLDSPRIDLISHSSITTFHAQLDLSRERFEIMASGKINVCISDDPGIPERNCFFNPEGSVLARWSLSDHLSWEATADWTTQYYHTLEGVPVGWSVDLLVPTNHDRPPEHALQIYTGIFSSFGQHHITLGAYDKYMYNLVFFADASQLFSSAIAGWSHNIKVGSGYSRGVEFLYKKDGDIFDCRAAYTLSRTDRSFEMVNDGITFPAKFDRRHIINLTTSLKLADGHKCITSLSGLFTCQSGHWETVAAGVYPSLTFFGEGDLIEYFTSVNNYKMPDYMRLDLGCLFSFKTEHLQELNVGIYNVFNRHNPFSIIYDDRSREWRQVSLIPIMPSFSYRIEF